MKKVPAAYLYFGARVLLQGASTLCHVLEDIFAYMVVLVSPSAYPLRRRKAVAPILDIVDSFPPMFLAAVRERKRALVHQPVEVDGFAVGVILGHKYVFEPSPPHAIVKPHIQLAHNLAPVGARYARTVERQRNEHVAIRIARHEVKGSPLRPVQGLHRTFVRAFSLFAFGFWARAPRSLAAEVGAASLDAMWIENRLGKRHNFDGSIFTVRRGI